MTCWITLQHPFWTQFNKMHDSHCIVSKCICENIHHATKSLLKRANLWPWASCLGCPAFVLLLQRSAVCVLSSLWLKINRKIKPVIILSLLTLVILSLLAMNAAQVFFGCLENLTHTSSTTVAWMPFLIMTLWDVIFQSIQTEMSDCFLVQETGLRRSKWLFQPQFFFSFLLFIVVIYHTMCYY